MTKEFKEVDPNDFLTFSKESPAHVLIEGYVIEIGGGGKAGVGFKQEIMKLAGWKHHALTSYGAHADLAAAAFNKLRQVLAQTDEPDQIRENLHVLSADDA